MSSSGIRSQFAPWFGTALLLVVTRGTAAIATPITFEYGGMITSADPSTGVTPDTPFSGTFTYDPAKAAQAQYLTIEGDVQYLFGQSESIPNSVADGSGLSLKIGSHPILTDPGGVSVDVDQIAYPGQYGYGTPNNPAPPRTYIDVSNRGINPSPLVVDVSLGNPSRALLGSLFPVPPASLDLADFPQANLSVSELIANGPPVMLFGGTIDHLTMVPEPAAAPLICLASALWLGRSARHRARRA